MPGFFDTIFSGGAQKAASDADIQAYVNATRAGVSDLSQAYGTGTQAVNAGIAAYQPLTALATQYNAVAPMLTNALGLGGATGNQAALTAFQGANPAYTFQQDQMRQAVMRGMAGGGMTASGNLLDALQKNSANIANQSYGQWLGNLQSLAGLGANIGNVAAGGISRGQYNLADLAQQYGQNQAGLQTNYASGVANANQLAAQGQAQGAQNLLGVGMALAGLPMGMGGGGGVGLGSAGAGQPYNFSNSPMGQAFSGMSSMLKSAFS